MIPVGQSEIRTTKGLQDIRSDPEPGIVVYVPMSPTRSAFWQPLWGRKTLMVSLGRTDPDLLPYYWRHDAIRFLNLPHQITGIPDQEDARYLIDLLGVRYMILDRMAYEPESLERIWTVLNTTYGMEEVFVDKSSSIFRVPGRLRAVKALKFRMSDRQSEFHLPYGWSNRLTHKDTVVAWITNKVAKIALPPAQAYDYLLSLDTMLLAEGPVSLRVAMGESELGSYNLTPGPNRLTIRIDRGTLHSSETNLVELIPDRRLGLPHTTGLGVHPQPNGIPIEVRSGGIFTRDLGSAEIIVGERRLSTHKRGLLVAIIDTLGQIENEQFEALVSEDTVQALESYIKSAPESATVAIASRTINFLFGGNIGQALRWLGFPEEVKLNPFNSLAVIAGKDGRVPILGTGAAFTSIGIGKLPKSSEAAIGLVGLELIRR